MSEYSFDGGMSYNGSQPNGEQQPAGGQGQEPKWFRDYMAKSAQQISDLTGQLEAMNAEKRQAEIAAAFEAKGYARSAAALFTGTPDKVDEWLGAHGDALAKAASTQQQVSPQGEIQQQQAGAPALPPSVQADLQRMQQMGQATATAPQAGSDDELASALRATSNPDEFFQVAKAHGWQYTRDNMGFA